MFKSISTFLNSPIMGRLYNQSMAAHQQFPIAFNARSLHITSTLSKEDLRNVIQKMPKRDEGTQGEAAFDIDNISSSQGLFPDKDTPNRLFNGIPFKEIPIVNVKCSKNNTLMNLTTADGTIRVSNSCGVEGFRGAKRATNVAAQATAITLSKKALEKGYKMVRVQIRGLGPGRMASLKGFELAGIDVISVTDNTRVTWTPLRPRKARRL